MSATVDRRFCRSRRHGTANAYRNHGCRCPDARNAERSYRKRLHAGHLPPALVPTVGSRRRLQALQAIGYPLAHLARELGYAGAASLSPLFVRPMMRRDLAERISVLYERISGTPGPSRSARIRARNAGFVPPLDWEDVDIEAPSAAPSPADALPERDDVDTVAVLLVIRGDLDTAILNGPERQAVAVELTRLGRSKSWIATFLRCSGATVSKLIG